MSNIDFQTCLFCEWLSLLIPDDKEFDSEIDTKVRFSLPEDPSEGIVILFSLLSFSPLSSPQGVG